MIVCRGVNQRLWRSFALVAVGFFIAVGGESLSAEVTRPLGTGSIDTGSTGTGSVDTGEGFATAAAFASDSPGMSGSAAPAGVPSYGRPLLRGPNSPMTLFQWSSGSWPSGPDLSQPLVTDRPDFTEASSTVGRGVLQIEVGYTYVGDNEDHTHSAPEALFRYGLLANWLELRLGQNYAGEVDGSLWRSGTQDLYLGAKIGLTLQDGILPEMAVIPQMTLPTGHSSMTSNQTLPGFNWLYGWDLNDRFSAGGSTQFNRDIDEGSDKAYTQWAQSWTIGASWTEQLGGYAEWFALLPHSADTMKPEYYFNGGFTYLLTNNVQWDIRAGTGLNSAAEDYFLGTGISVRLY